MMRLLAAIALVSLVVVPGAATADHIACPFDDAPQLPGALSQYYDMWNNMWRHYTCGHIVGLADIEVLA